jgi:hypothetical protein
VLAQGLRGPVTFARNAFLLSYVPRSMWVTLLVFVRMSVAVIPVFRLLLLIRLRVFVRTLVVVTKVLPPGFIFVVVPVVIILGFFTVNSVLIVILLRCGAGHQCPWRRKRSGKKQRSDVTICRVHVVVLQMQNVRW